MPSNSPLDDPILRRRRQLRRQRQWKLLQASWRSLAIAGLTSGLLWAISQPEWMIRQSRQVAIQGNRLVSSETLLALLPLSLPQSLIHIQPEVLAATLEAHAPIAKTVITRKLLPPRLIIEVQERPPVAIATCERSPTPAPTAAVCLLVAEPRQGGSVTLGPSKLWLLDNQGIPLPLESYPGLEGLGKLPQLKVLGLFEAPSQTQTAQTPTNAPLAADTTVVMNAKKQSQWRTLYPLLNQSPVGVFEVDWRQANNLILKTELGVVHLGPYSSKFEQQLQALDQMRQLPKYLNPKQVAYIDLENPEHPLLQLLNVKQGQKPINPFP